MHAHYWYSSGVLGRRASACERVRVGADRRGETREEGKEADEGREEGRKRAGPVLSLIHISEPTRPRLI
eukprot:1115262-Rhodomonas_salina.4